MEYTYKLYTEDRSRSKGHVHYRTVHPETFEVLSENEVHARRGEPCRVAGCVERHEHAPSEPDFPAGWVPSETVYPDPTDPSQGCPCCGESVQSIEFEDADTWCCTGCGYSPSVGLDVDHTLDYPVDLSYRHISGIGVYRDAELAAAAVMYHEGEPVMPEMPVIDEWNYPAAWDWLAVPVTMRRDAKERQRELAREGLLARRERQAINALRGALDATLV